MTFIVHSEISEQNIAGNLGKPEYSYFFVLRKYLPVLRELGQVVVVRDPLEDVDRIYDACRQRGEQCIFISFSPPHKSVMGLRCPTLCVLAWEFDRIPDEVWDENPKNDWRNVFADHGRVITLSQYAAEAVKRAMGEDFPVAVIPVPVWDDFADFDTFYNGSPPEKTEITIQGNVVDSCNYLISQESIEMRNVFENIHFDDFPGGTIRLGFTLSDEYPAYLGGFYHPEDWGTWSRLENPWVLLPFNLVGDIKARIRLDGYAYNADRGIFVSLGSEKKKIQIKGGFADADITFHLSDPANILHFSNLDLTPVPNFRDTRSMGIGLHFIELSVASGPYGKLQPKNERKKAESTVWLDGIVYTSVLTPGDDRKNWTDMVKAFGAAFQDRADATLVLKMTHNSIASFIGELHFLLQQMWPFKCRIVALHGYLDEADYKNLIAGTSFYVNTSRCEGLCMPLMEFFACGKPAIAPFHTSLMDYVDEGSALRVRSSAEPAIWPHDDRQFLRTLRYRLDWESLMDAYRRSYDIIKNQPDVYKRMAQAARLSMQRYSSQSDVKIKLQTFLRSTESHDHYSLFR